MVKLDYVEQIERELKKAIKSKNVEAQLFYTQAFGKSATVSFDTFKGSFAYAGWLKKNADKIEQLKYEQIRFGWL